MARVKGKVYYQSGALCFDGEYDSEKSDVVDGVWIRERPCRGGKGKYLTMLLKYSGTLYYENGNKKAEGIFRWRGLRRGRMYYPSGALKYEGEFNDEKASGDYYGPSYPTHGKFYAEDGTLLYEGKFEITRIGSLGYPKVIIPEGFGALT